MGVEVDVVVADFVEEVDQGEDSEVHLAVVAAAVVASGAEGDFRTPCDFFLIFSHGLKTFRILLFSIFIMIGLFLCYEKILLDMLSYFQAVS